MNNLEKYIQIFVVVVTILNAVVATVPNLGMGTGEGGKYNFMGQQDFVLKE